MKYLTPHQNNYEVCLLLHLFPDVSQGFEFQQHLSRIFFILEDLHLILSQGNPVPGFIMDHPRRAVEMQFQLLVLNQPTSNHLCASNFTCNPGGKNYLFPWFFLLALRQKAFVFSVKQSIVAQAHALYREIAQPPSSNTQDRACKPVVTLEVTYFFQEDISKENI